MSVGEALRTVPASVAKTYGTPLGTLFRTRDDAAAVWAHCSGPAASANLSLALGGTVVFEVRTLSCVR